MTGSSRQLRTARVALALQAGDGVVRLAVSAQASTVHELREAAAAWQVSHEIVQWSPGDLENAVRAADVATADAEDHQHRACELRLDLAQRLRELEVGYQDIGRLLEIHARRVRLLLESHA